MALLCATAVAVAAFSWFKPLSHAWHALTIAAGAALFGSFGFYVVEYSSDMGFATGALIAGIAAILGLVGAVLLAVGTSVGAPVANTATAGPSPLPAHNGAAAPQMQPVAVGAEAAPGPGWYPDPAGSGGRRYWDGRVWTDQVDATA